MMRLAATALESAGGFSAIEYGCDGQDIVLSEMAYNLRKCRSRH